MCRAAVGGDAGMTTAVAEKLTELLLQLNAMRKTNGFRSRRLIARRESS